VISTSGARHGGGLRKAGLFDPKGELANLMLTSPELRGNDFQSRVDPAEAHRRKQFPRCGF
jgi:hypothetical protein